MNVPLKRFIFLLSNWLALNLFLITLSFDERPFFRPNAIIAFFVTVAEKPMGSSNLKIQVVDN